MGVHDYRCSVCGTPASYTCEEATGGTCEEEGLGNDEAVLDLFFFAAPDAPARVEDFEAARVKARRSETRPFGYDWGEWEFVPSLNYRQLLMDDEDATGIWSVQPFDEALSDGTAIGIDIPEDERLWVVNYCPPCHALFVDRRAPAEAPCREYLRTIAENLSLEFDDSGGPAAKAPFIERVRGLVARRRPVPR